MTFKKMKDLVGVWYSQFKYSNFNPEIRLDTEPSFYPTHYTITMRYKGKVIKRGITDQILFYMTGTGFMSMLDEMWDEINKSRTNGLLDDPPSFSRITLRPYDPTVFGKKRLGDNIKRVIFSGPFTIVIWNDGTKTMVKCADEKFDKEKGLAMCIAKKFLGNKGKYYDVFKKWIEEDEQ